METLSVVDEGAVAIDVVERAVDAAVAGDADAFESLMRRGLARTFRLALGILGSEFDARDAVQDGWLAAWRHLPELADRGRFDAWIDRIVVNACRMVIRRRRGVREIPMPMGFDAESADPGPDQIGERQELERAFDRLTLDQRTILVLHHLENRPLAEIAEILAIPVGTAKSRLHGARRTLARRLEDVT